jgi:hypothetical protein
MPKQINDDASSQAIAVAKRLSVMSKQGISQYPK